MDGYLEVGTNYSTDKCRRNVGDERVSGSKGWWGEGRGLLRYSDAGMQQPESPRWKTISPDFRGTLR